MSMENEAFGTKQFVAGRWRDGRSGRVLDVHDPFTGKFLTGYRMASPQDVAEAYESARAAQRG